MMGLGDGQGVSPGNVICVCKYFLNPHKRDKYLHEILSSKQEINFSDTNHYQSGGKKPGDAGFSAIFFLAPDG